MPPEWKCLRAALPRLVLLYDLSLLLLSAAALPVLRQCGLITVYRCTHQCGERSNAAFRTQSAAKQTSLAPHDSKARLRPVSIRRRFMAKPCTPHLHCAARAVIQAINCQCRGRGELPSPFSGGFKGGILFGKRIPPLVSRRARRSPSRAYAGKGAALSGYPSLRAARGKHLRPCGRKKEHPYGCSFSNR